MAGQRLDDDNGTRVPGRYLWLGTLSAIRRHPLPLHHHYHALLALAYRGLNYPTMVDPIIPTLVLLAVGVASSLYFTNSSSVALL